MKTLPLTVLGSLIGAAFLTLASPANAAVHIHGGQFHHSLRVNTVRRQIGENRQALRSDRADLNRDSGTLHADRQDGASRGQVADDRSAIQQDQRDIERDSRRLQVEHGELNRDLANQE